MGKLQDGLKVYNGLSRADYMKKNQELAELLWEHESVPTVGDIAQFLMYGKDESGRMQSIFDFFGNEADFKDMAQRQGELYEEEESLKFIQNVMSSNNTDISEAGYFYKLLMASADDFVVVDKDCGDEGDVIVLSDLDELTYNYRVRMLYVKELKAYSRMDHETFMQKCQSLGLEKVHVRHPLRCGCFPHDSEEHERSHKMYGNRRGVCKRCSGALPGGVVNLGPFMALMVTEFATQAALNSMNKGKKRNVNMTVTSAYQGEFDWESISKWITGLTEELKGDMVSSRFYEIALMSRVRFDKDGPYISSLQGSINRSGNLMSAYIFAPTNRAFERMIDAGEFEDYGLKLQIAMNQYLMEVKK